jgi:hypothetical protein
LIKLAQGEQVLTQRIYTRVVLRMECRGFFRLLSNVTRSHNLNDKSYHSRTPQVYLGLYALKNVALHSDSLSVIAPVKLSIINLL